MGKTKNKNLTKINVYTSKKLLNEELIANQAEAYYQALKRIEKDKEVKDIQPSKVKKLDIMNLLLLLCFRPSKIKKINMADNLLRLITSSVLAGIGSFIRIAATAVFIYLIYKQNMSLTIIGFVTNTMALIVAVLYGGIFIAASKEIENKDDMKYIISYTSSLMGVLAFVLALIALFV